MPDITNQIVENLDLPEIDSNVHSPELNKLLDDLTTLLVKVIDTENVSKEDEDQFDEIYRRYAELSDLDKSKSGIYHFAGLGKTTWKDFAEEIFFQTKVSVIVNSVKSSSWYSKVSRPTNSYLSSEKFAETFGYFPAHWKNALKEIIMERKIVPVKVGDFVNFENKQHIIVSTDWLKRIARIANPLDMEKSVEIPFEILSL